MTSHLGGTRTLRPPDASLGGPAAGMGMAAPGLEVTMDDDIVLLTVVGHLDAAVGVAVGVAAEGALRLAPRRLDIDLRQVASFTTEGVAALRACRLRAAGLREGLHYRTGRGPGREALLAAYPPPGMDD